MSNDAISATWRVPGLKQAPKLVLAILADAASDHEGEDWTCFPSVVRIAEFGSMNVKTVERALEVLTAQKLVRAVRVRKANGYLAGYRFRLNRKLMTEYLLAWFERNRARMDEEPFDWDEGLDEPLQPADNLSGGLDDPSDISSPIHPTICPEPSDKLSDQEPKTNPQSNPHSASARRTNGSAVISRSESRKLFDQAAFAYPAKGRKVTRWPVARKAWERAAKVHGADRLAVAAERYAADPDVAGLNFVPGLHTWLDDEVFLAFLPGAETQARQVSAPEAAGWRGPAEIRSAVVAARGEDFAAAYLDQGQWDGEARRVTCASGIAAERLWAAMGDEFTRTMVAVAGPQGRSAAA